MRPSQGIHKGRFSRSHCTEGRYSLTSKCGTYPEFDSPLSEPLEEIGLDPVWPESSFCGATTIASSPNGSISRSPHDQNTRFEFQTLLKERGGVLLSDNRQECVPKEDARLPIGGTRFGRQRSSLPPTVERKVRKEDRSGGTV